MHAGNKCRLASWGAWRGDLVWGEEVDLHGDTVLTCVGSVNLSRERWSRVVIRTATLSATILLSFE